MPKYLTLLAASPPSIKRGILALIVGWIGHSFFLVRFFGDQIPERILFQQIAIGVIMLLFILSLKKWARVLCILCSSLIVLLYFFIAILLYDKRPELSLVSALIVVSLSVSVYYLWSKPSSEFYDAVNKKPPEQEASEADER